MKYDTAGNKIYKPIQNRDCRLTGKCNLCRPSFIGSITDEEANKMKERVEKWKKQFEEDLEKRNKRLFPQEELISKETEKAFYKKVLTSQLKNKNMKEQLPFKTLKEVIYIYEDGSKWRMLNVPNYIENSKTLNALIAARSYIRMKPVEWERINFQLKLWKKKH